MLTPEYIQQLTEGAERIAEELHRDIVDRIVKRIMLRIGRGDGYVLTAQDKWQLEVLQDAGYLLEDIQAEIARKSGLQLREMKEAFEDAGVRAVTWDNAIYKAVGLSPSPLMQSPALVRLIQRGYEATVREWKNFTRTTANAAQQIFIRECDRAYHLVSSGLVSYQQAAREAVERIAGTGVTVTYPSGHVDTIETATLRAVRTGVAQACGEITDARMEEMGWDIVLVSAHLGARVTDREDFTNHYWWQGQFYSRSGKDKRFPALSVCGQGDVQGILGANCRHSYGPGDGENNPFEHFGSEENRKAYELSQRQRTLERRIRKTKREVQALKTALDNVGEGAKPEIQAAYQKKAALLKKQNAAYRDFCGENGLRQLSDRVSIAKWDRKQAAQTRTAANKKVPEIPQREASDVTAEYALNAQPGAGLVTIEDGYKRGGHQNEIDTAKWLHDTFGGDITLRKESDIEGKKTPDFTWDGKSWELKNITTAKSADDAIKRGLKQIQDSPGGIILDLQENDVDISLLQEKALGRSRRSNLDSFDILLLSKGKLLKAIRYRYKK